MLLYHYTTIESFEKIIETNFWKYTSPANTNDTRETNSFLNDEIFSKVRFICGSINNTNPAMWAHYAHGQNGVCIGLDLPEKNFIFKKINYDNLPCDNNKKFDYNSAIEYLSYKSNAWSYENEIRAFLKLSKDTIYCLEGFNGCVQYIDSLVLGNNVKYDTLGEKTIKVVYELFDNNKLFGYLSNQGDAKALPICSPILCEVFNKTNR